MIETSSDILDEYYEYSKEIENQKYRFVFYETLLGTPNKAFVVPTTLGDRNMEIGQYTSFFSLSFKVGIWQLSCFAISNGFANANNYLTDSSNQVFFHSDTMCGIEFKNIMKNFSIKAGGIFEEYSFIETNEYGEGLFSYVYSIGNTLGELVPAFHYFRFNEIKQFGFGHYEIAPTDYSQLNYEFFLDLGTIRLAYCTLEASIYIPSRNH
ncbi:MAG TPA: hypothetical protein PLS97_05740 [Rectinema sp.]|nr:hypothetical protein [Rectinema sp.]HOR48808.1 hypothetical protein [Rectinema sp.]